MFNSFMLPFMLHGVSSFFIAFATLLLFVWLVKFATKSQLKKWIITLYILGILGAIGTAYWGVKTFPGDPEHPRFSSGSMMRNWDKNDQPRLGGMMNNWNKN